MPATAFAARIELLPAPYGTQQLTFTAGPDEVNDPSMQSNIFSHHLQDFAGPPIEAIPPCEPNPETPGLGTSARCPTIAVKAFFDLGDRDDLGNIDQNTQLFIPVTVRGGPGRDRISMHSQNGNILDGGSGDDVIASEVLFPTGPPGEGDSVVGGDGNDTLATRNGRRDGVGCGSGWDTVTADGTDDVAPDCEVVDRSSGPEWTRADGSPVGVTINSRALFTNKVRVRLTVRGPDAATHARISNDGGFGAFVTIPRMMHERYRFELRSSGPESLPKTVYVRFDGPGLDPSRTFTDDIILDETRPQVRSARALRRSRRGLRIALRASDSTSGVKKAQFARVRRKPFAAVRYRTRITTRASARWARVRDGAGNASRWRRIAR